MNNEGYSLNDRLIKLSWSAARLANQYETIREQGHIVFDLEDHHGLIAQAEIVLSQMSILMSESEV